MDKVLRCGQLFRWRREGTIWSCLLFGRVVFVRQDSKNLYYSVKFSANDEIKMDDTESRLRDYFNLDIELNALYNEWALKDKHFANISQSFEGVRMLRQDPWETLISFICSQNNNVKRISKMCSTLCERFGKYILTHDGVDYYQFPTLKLLSLEEIEPQLRSLGFGYRARYIQQTALEVYLNKVELNNFRDLSHEECHTELRKFMGVGPKVADCICLMSMDKHEVVPIDTHVFNFAKRDYKFRFKQGSSAASLNPQRYLELQDFFKLKWGDYAGWAHSVLFALDLKDLNNGVNVEKPVVKSVVKSE